MPRRKRKLDVKTLRARFRKVSGKTPGDPGRLMQPNKFDRFYHFYIMRSFHHFPALGREWIKVNLGKKKIWESQGTLAVRGKQLQKAEEKLQKEMLETLRKKVIKSGKARTVEEADSFIMEQIERFKKEDAALNEKLASYRFSDQVTANKRLTQEAAGLYHLYASSSHTLHSCMEVLEKMIKGKKKKPKPKKPE